MDALSFLLDAIRAELGDDIFTDDRRQQFELAMRQQLGGERHYFASAAAKLRAERNAVIVRFLMEGGSATAAVERFGLNERQIYNIRQQAIDSGQFKNCTALP